MDGIFKDKTLSGPSAFEEEGEREKKSTGSLGDTSANEQRSTDEKLPAEKTTPSTSSLNDESGVFLNVSSSETFPNVPSSEATYLDLDIINANNYGVGQEASKTGARPSTAEERLEEEGAFSRGLSRAASFPITRRSSARPTIPLVTPPRNKAAVTTSWKEGPIPKLGLNRPLSHIEKIIAIASEKNEAALAAANANRASLTATALSVKQGEFHKLANLWVKVAEVSSLLQDETNQLRELTRQMELSQSLLESQSEIDIENAPSRKKKLLQDQIDLLRRTIIPHEKRVNFLFRGTSIIDQWIRDFWTNHLIFVTSPSSVADVDDPEMQEKENCYKNGVSILQILAANHSEDEDQESASFFAAVAESEYSNMQHIALENQEKRDEIMERNKSILAFCSTVDSLQEKIKEDKDLAQTANQERVAFLYGEAAQWDEENCRLIMYIVEQLISGNEATSELERRSGVLSELASGAELQAQRIKDLEKEEYSLRFTTRIVNKVRGGK